MGEHPLFTQENHQGGCMTSPFVLTDKNIAKPFEFFMARKFGEKIISRCEGYTCIAYVWRGVTYIDTLKRDNKGAQQ